MDASLNGVSLAQECYLKYYSEYSIYYLIIYYTLITHLLFITHYITQIIDIIYSLINT